MMTSYLGAYESDDSKSIKSCQTVLLFGEPVSQNKDNNKEFGWKYIKLPCPHCNFAHDFKRQEWQERFESPVGYAGG